MRFSIEFLRAFFFILKHFSPIWGGIAIVISLVGFLIALLEEEIAASEGLYFAWVTGTTVGYGDLVPTLGITRFLAILVALNGILLTGIIVAIAMEAAKIAIGNSISMQDFKQAVTERTQRRAVRERKDSAK